MSWVMKPEDVKPCPTCDRPCWFGLHVRHPEDVDENHCPNWRLADQIKTLRAELAKATSELDEARDKLDEAQRNWEEDLYELVDPARRAARTWKALAKHYRETRHVHGITRCEDCNKPANVECLHRWRCMPCFEEWKERYERDKETR